MLAKWKQLFKPSDLLFYSTFDKMMQQINNPTTTNKNYKKGLKEDIASYQKVTKLPTPNMRSAEDLPPQFSLRKYTPTTGMRKPKGQKRTLQGITPLTVT